MKNKLSPTRFFYMCLLLAQTPLFHYLDQSSVVYRNMIYWNPRGRIHSPMSRIRGCKAIWKGGRFLYWIAWSVEPESVSASCDVFKSSFNAWVKLSGIVALSVVNTLEAKGCLGLILQWRWHFCRCLLFGGCSVDRILVNDIGNNYTLKW